jgi:hypothetical protein
LQRSPGRHEQPRPTRAPDARIGRPLKRTRQGIAKCADRLGGGYPAEPRTPHASRGVIARNTIVQPTVADYKRPGRRSPPGCRRHQLAHMRASWRSSSSSQPRAAASWNMAWNSVESIVGTFSETHLRLNRCGTSKIGIGRLYNPRAPGCLVGTGQRRVGIAGELALMG